MAIFFSQALKPAFPDLKVEIQDMLADDDKVVTRKLLKGTHTGPLMGLPPTGKNVEISVIDIFTVKDGKLKEHWTENNFGAVMAYLQS